MCVLNNPENVIRRTWAVRTAVSILRRRQFWRAVRNTDNNLRRQFWRAVRNTDKNLRRRQFWRAV